MNCQAAQCRTSVVSEAYVFMATSVNVGIGRADGSLAGRGIRHEPLRRRMNDDQNG